MIIIVLCIVIVEYSLMYFALKFFDYLNSEPEYEDYSDYWMR